MSIVLEYDIKDIYNINKWHCDILYPKLNLFTITLLLAYTTIRWLFMVFYLLNDFLDFCFYSQYLIPTMEIKGVLHLL